MNFHKSFHRASGYWTLFFQEVSISSHKLWVFLFDIYLLPSVYIYRPWFITCVLHIVYQDSCIVILFKWSESMINQLILRRNSSQVRLMSFHHISIGTLCAVNTRLEFVVNVIWFNWILQNISKSFHLCLAESLDKAYQCIEEYIILVSCQLPL